MLVSILKSTLCIVPSAISLSISLSLSLCLSDNTAAGRNNRRELEYRQEEIGNKMVNLDSVTGRALVAVSSGTTAPATAASREAARLFLSDVTQTLRWHAVVAGVALAATPIVYQLSRVVAQRYRAELVRAAKDAVQRDELFNGAEADGVMIDPADEGGITISYNTLSTARRRRSENGRKEEEEEAGGQEGLGNKSGTTTTTTTSGALSVSSMWALRVGRRHSWALASFAHAVLAAQRVPNVQFVRTCSRAAVWQYSAVVLRLCTTSCALCVASLAVTHACCTTMDLVVPLVGGSTRNPAGGVTAALRDLVSSPLFDGSATVPPSVSSCYGLYDFSLSASGVWSRLIPYLAPVQTWYQRICGRLQPLHMEWREGGTSRHAAADAVWAALTPRGYFVAALLPRLPWRIFAGLQWAATKVSNAAVRRWYDAAAAAATSPVNTSTPPPPPSSLSASASTSHVSQPQPPPQQPSRRASKGSSRPHTKLVHAPLVKAAMLFASDVAFASVVFAATWWVSGGGGGGVEGSPRALVRNAAGARYNAFCWVEVLGSVMTLVVL